MKVYEKVKLVVVAFSVQDVLTESALSGSVNGGSQTKGVYEGVNDLSLRLSEWF